VAVMMHAHGRYGWLAVTVGILVVPLPDIVVILMRSDSAT